MYLKKQAQNLGTVQKRMQIQITDELTGLIYNQICSMVKKIREHSSKIRQTVFEKNVVPKWRRVGLNFRYHFINRGEILYKMAMFNYFATADFN